MFRNHAAALSDIKEQLDAADEAEFLALTDDLIESDFTLIGQLIQTYCYADVNARRVIDNVRGAAGERQNGSLLNDKDTLTHLRTVAERLPPSDVKDGLLLAVGTIEMHREHRHHFAHWAVRRTRGHDAFIFFTKNAREATKRDGRDLAADELKYGLVALAPLREELVKLIGHSKYVAEAAAYLEGQTGTLRAYFEAQASS